MSCAAEPDIVHDLNQVPWPLPAGHFNEVQAFDVIEHLDNVINVMEEIHRVCVDSATVRITVPHFSCSNTYTDPTHRRAFGYYSMDCVTGKSQNQILTQVRFAEVASRIVFYPSLLNKLVWRLANRFPAAYEKRWAWMFPAWFIYFEFRVVKDG
jgi:hypothetical protein